MILSILIPTLDTRHEMLAGLLSHLQAQPHPNVEILTEPDDGTLSVGAKRNMLVARACGDYIAFVDDDDQVSDSYISSILQAIESKPDVVGIRGILETNGNENTRRKFEHSIKYHCWSTRADGVLLRCPNHLNPVKRSIASQVPFLEISHGEDRAYSMLLRPLLNSEVMIEEPIYFYRFVSRKIKAALKCAQPV